MLTKLLSNSRLDKSYVSNHTTGDFTRTCCLEIYRILGENGREVGTTDPGRRPRRGEGNCRGAYEIRIWPRNIDRRKAIHTQHQLEEEEER